MVVVTVFYSHTDNSYFQIEKLYNNYNGAIEITSLTYLQRYNLMVLKLQ